MDLAAHIRAVFVFHACLKAYATWTENSGDKKKFVDPKQTVI